MKDIGKVDEAKRNLEELFPKVINPIIIKQKDECDSADDTVN